MRLQLNKIIPTINDSIAYKKEDSMVEPLDGNITDLCIQYMQVDEKTNSIYPLSYKKIQSHMKANGHNWNYYKLVSHQNVDAIGYKISESPYGRTLAAVGPTATSAFLQPSISKYIFGKVLVCFLNYDFVPFMYFRNKNDYISFVGRMKAMEIAAKDKREVISSEVYLFNADTLEIEKIDTKKLFGEEIGVAIIDSRDPLSVEVQLRKESHKLSIRMFAERYGIVSVSLIAGDKEHHNAYQAIFDVVFEELKTRYKSERKSTHD